MKTRKILLGLIWFGLSVAVTARVAASGTDAKNTAPEVLAPTPPMGWNSWDGYGTTVTESDVKANAKWMADHLKAFGWQYVTVDMEWFVQNPTAEGNSKNFRYSLDQFGRYTPALNRFPSAANGAGFKPLSEYVHSLGLKFGIHILRGIPRQAVVSKLPIADSPYLVADGADPSDTCPWNFDNFGTDASKPAAQAYYDSIAKLYAGWGVDFIKVDCIASRPYKGDDIRMIREALDKSGRPIVLSLSPGAAPVEKTDEMKRYAQMWRISDDIWDLWHSSVPYPQGLGDQFANAAKWAGKSEPGHWPDADMLALGYLGPAPGWGPARPTRLSHEEQQTLMTLWAIFRSPLMVGGDLTKADDGTASLLTNPEVIAVDQHSTDNHPVISTDTTIVWTGRSTAGNISYIAIFNISGEVQKVHYAWKDLGFAASPYQLRDLWKRKDLGSSDAVDVSLPSHGSVLFAVSAGGKPMSVQFSDEPQFKIAGVVDPTNYGGHGSDAVLRTKEELARETNALKKESRTPASGTSSTGPEAWELHRRSGDAAESAGHPLEAVREYQLAAEMEPSEQNLFAWAAELLLHRAFAPAVEVFSKAHRQFPESVRIAVGLGIATYDRGETEVGKQTLLAASDIKPADITPYLFMGRLQEGEKTVSPEWAERLRRFTDIDPNNAMAHYSYAVALSKQAPTNADPLAVESELEEALKLEPTLGKANLQLGILLAANKQTAAAIAAFNKAVENLPLPDEAHYRLAQLYRQTGDTEEARKEIALFNETSRQKAKQEEEQRHEIQQFVYTLRQQQTDSPVDSLPK